MTPAAAHADDVTVVWVAPADDPGKSPTGGGRDDAARALRQWAHTRGVTLVQAATAQASDALPIDLSIADRAEKDLERAREAIAALDADAAERALARAETLLREHPELPQAAWLRAEVSRTFAARWTRIAPKDEARARAAWQDADAIDGGRSVGIGETAFVLRPVVRQTIVLHGDRGPRVVVRLDGNPLAKSTSENDRTTYVADVGAAEHQLVVSVDGAPVFASWISTAGEPTERPAPVDIRLPGGEGCAATSFASVKRDDTSIRADGVTCDRWVAAIPGERRDSVLVARCERTTCGPLLEWRIDPFGHMGPPQALAPSTTWPAWATWTLVGIGAATATTVALVATGAFETRPTETRFVAGGVRVESR